MPDDHSEVVPLLPIPNRTVKRLCADDSADSRVKVGHRQALIPKTPSQTRGRFFWSITFPAKTLRAAEHASESIWPRVIVSDVTAGELLFAT